MNKPHDVDEEDIADLYSPWRSVFALVVVAIAVTMLALYPPSGQRAVLYAGVGGLIGYGVGITEHIIQLQERRAWRRVKHRIREVAD